ncbi:MAG: M48 family metallopeptidase [candidate division Zixibacteria bacterium]|nr:M48 family metallopeptidase [candidate division Zixibacteria bacterium]
MRYLILSILVAALFTSCATTGPGGDKSFIIIPTSQEIAIGAGMAKQVASTEKTFKDMEWQRYLAEVGNKIVAVSDRKDIVYHFTVIESDDVNAFAAPGGYVYFYTGLLRHMESEAEMAAVMAHEISHVVARHGVKRVQTALGVGLASQLVLGGNSSEVLAAAINIGMGVAFAGYSRDAEREADSFGIYYMKNAGYNPNGAIGMFDKLAAVGAGASTNVFEKLSRSHPETQERIDRAKEQISSMRGLSKNLRDGRERYQQMKARLPKAAQK